MSKLDMYKNDILLDTRVSAKSVRVGWALAAPFSGETTKLNKAIRRHLLTTSAIITLGSIICGCQAPGGQSPTTGGQSAATAGNSQDLLTLARQEFPGDAQIAPMISSQLRVAPEDAAGGGGWHDCQVTDVRSSSTGSLAYPYTVAVTCESGKDEIVNGIHYGVDH